MKQEPQTFKYHLKAIWAILLNKPQKSKSLEETENTPPTDEKIRLLIESPTLNTQSLKFGHEQIIGALKKVIFASGSSMTIGLFGGWGTGKSSIVENLKINLLEDGIPVVIFDVWKHNGDALRRTFLKNMDVQLSGAPYGENYIIDQNILSPQVFSTIKDSSEKINIKTKRFFYNLLVLFLIAFLVIGSILISCLVFQELTGIHVFDLLMQSKTISGTGALLTTGLTGGLVFKYIDSFIKVEKSEAEKEKLQDPHEFETEFHRLVNNLKPEIQSLVVVFDNLDRVSGDNVLTVISTIKTFLDFRSEEGKKVIFLIPCDESAIKVHIQYSLNNDDPAYVDEFLRKFFNTSLWIPEFYENELEGFATEKLKETGVKDFENDRLAWLVIRAFHRNPRQIVQFINILLANYLLVKEFCEKGAFEDIDFYKTNLLQLAKFLALKMCFPEIISLYQQKGVYDIYDEDVDRKLSNKENGYFDYKQFQDLLERTREIKLGSLETYFRFRLSKDEQLIPGLSNILNEIIYGTGQVKLSEDLVNKLNIPALSNAIRVRFHSDSNQYFQFSILTGALTFAAKFNITLTDNLYKDLLDLTMKKIRIESLSLDPELIRDALLFKINPLPIADLNKLIDNYISPLTGKDIKISDEYVDKLLNFLISFKDYFATTQLERLSNILVQHYLNDKITFKILKDEGAQEKFIDDKFKEHITTQLTKVSAADCLHIYSILPLVQFGDNFTGVVFNAIAESFLKIWISYKSDETNSEILIGLTEQTLLNLMTKDRSDAEPFLVKLISGLQTQANNIKFLPIILQLNKQKGIEHAIQDYFVSVISSAQFDEISLLIKHIEINIILQPETLEVLFERIILFENASEVLMPALNAVNQVNYLQLLLSKAIFPELEKAWSLSSEVESDEFHSLVNKIVIYAKENNNRVRLDELQILLRIILLSSKKGMLSANEEFIDLIMVLIRREPTTELFATGVTFLETLTNQPDAPRKKIASILIETVYELNYSTIKKIYQQLFSLFNELSNTDKNRLRDLIYIHLLHHLNADVANLETAIYATEFSGEFDFHNSEKYFNDFLAIAENYKESGVSAYYEKLTKIILLKLKKYQSNSFKEIKRSLKSLINNEK